MSDKTPKTGKTKTERRSTGDRKTLGWQDNNDPVVQEVIVEYLSRGRVFPVLIQLWGKWTGTERRTICLKGNPGRFICQWVTY